jgi:hypothetical protein
MKVMKNVTADAKLLRQLQMSSAKTIFFSLSKKNVRFIKVASMTHPFIINFVQWQNDGKGANWLEVKKMQLKIRISVLKC